MVTSSTHGSKSLPESHGGALMQLRVRLGRGDGLLMCCSRRGEGGRACSVQRDGRRGGRHVASSWREGRSSAVESAGRRTLNVWARARASEAAAAVMVVWFAYHRLFPNLHGIFVYNRVCGEGERRGWIFLTSLSSESLHCGFGTLRNTEYRSDIEPHH